MTHAAPTPHDEKRLVLRPPVGIPTRDAPGRRATIISLLLHALIVALVLAPPVFMASTLDYTPKQGAGGKGPAGGGGGGTSGTGGGRTASERLRFLVLPPAARPAPETAVEQPVPVPPRPEEKKPEPPPAPTPPPEVTAPAVSAPAAASTVTEASALAGTGGGTGKDGTAGSGPGRGGGVGSGVGTGRGSGVGPGTGGGDDEIYPPAVVALPLLPLPVPGKVRPYKLVAYFEVDTLGNARLLAFNPSNDGGYNRRIREMLGEIRFRPATRTNGRPVVDTAVVTAEAPRS